MKFIKKIINFLFGNNKPSIEKHVEEPIEVKIEKVVCHTHVRFKRSCPTCVAAAQ